jgi:YXWGXW repeat-containing protein
MMRPTVLSIFGLGVACTRAALHPPYSAQPVDALVEVAAPPPPARVESVPQRPDPTAVWIDGEWTWRRQKWAWIAGRWVDPPFGSTFSPWTFVRSSDLRFWYAPGTWRDAKGATLTPPATLATAKVDGSEVVNARGQAPTVGATVSSAATSASPSPRTLP